MCIFNTEVRKRVVIANTHRRKWRAEEQVQIGPRAVRGGAGALQSQFTQLSAQRSPESDSSGSGPSLSGDRASAPGLTLLDLDTYISGGATLLPLLRRINPDRDGDWLRPLLDRYFDSPRAISSFTTEKNPCFRSITAEAES